MDVNNIVIKITSFIKLYYSLDNAFIRMEILFLEN